MGNTICGAGGGGGKTRLQQESQLSKNSGKDEADLPLTIEDLDEHRLEQLLREMKEYHKNRLQQELETDPHNFILDNLLMCIQFFDNFEKAKDEANQFKWDTEREMTAQLAEDPLEGTILGDRRVKLMTGMSHVLAQNYIYQGKHQVDEEEEADIYYGGLGFKDTFMAEGILPLDFTMTWDNLELYDQREWHHLREYSDAKGASPIGRYCMEQPDKKTNFPKGYVRLRCVDEPIPYRRKLDTPPSHPPPPNNDFVYDHIDRQEESVYSKPDSDGIPEVNSESESDEAHNSEPTSDEDDEDRDMKNLHNILNALPTSPKHKQGFGLPGTSTPPSKARTRPHLQKLNLSQLPGNVQPSFVVHAPTPPVLDSSAGFHQNQNENNPYGDYSLLHPPTKRGRTFDTLQQQQQSNRSPRDSPGKETSSGYETTSTISRSSSMQSSHVRDKWQKFNLKKLWEFGKKSRKEFIIPNGKYDPLPPNCYSEIKYEFSYDDSIEEEDEDADEIDSSESSSEESSDGYSLSSNIYGQRKKKKRKETEDEYEMRFYLNSLQVSSNACSEFHYIGPKMNIPQTSLASGVVLGTTIRCPMPYTFPIEPKEDDSDDDDIPPRHYYVTRTFTPSLHSKTWPDSLYDNFRLHVGSLSPHFNSPTRGEMWPTRLQLEQIESSGCNAIPLGFRSMEFFNAEQILEWELNFQDSEVHLLNSFMHPHWRAYIFSAILFRAFISPLGPQGIGLEHIRNVLYFMCHENFTGWEDEQPGLHLRILLDNLYRCLSRTSMPSFFVRSRNLLRGIPQPNLRFVQGHLSRVKENLTIYCIYAFGNLSRVKGMEESYPVPNFRRLYDILTVPDVEVLVLITPILKLTNDQENKEVQDQARARAKKKQKKQQKSRLIDQQDAIDRDFFSSQREVVGMSQPPPKRDRTKERLMKAHEKYMQEMKDHKKHLKEQDKLKKDPEHRIPRSERRKSIDLKKSPVMPERFTPLRLLTMIQFFVKHFLRMAEKAINLQNYSQATMYVLQVENLCEIVTDPRYKYREGPSPFREDELDGYREQTLRLRAILDKDMHKYILARLITPSSPSLSHSRSINHSLYSLETPTTPGFNPEKNWDLRKLPTPPPSKKEVQTQQPPPVPKKLEMPNISSSLQSFEKLPKSSKSSSPSLTPIPPVVDMEEDQNTVPKLPTEKTRVARRQESIKFVSSLIPKETPPSTPPRSARSLRPRISVQLDTEVESTDL